MAAKQTRRSVSLAGPVYTAALQHAHANDMTLPELVTAALRVFLDLPATEHQRPERAKKAVDAKLEVRL